MPQPRALILRAPGTNCDVETAYAFERAGGRADRWHINRLLENPRLIADYQILCFPGGFSFGDDLGAGRILGSQIRTHLAEAMRTFKDAGKLILGICNGFQILMKSGILLADDPQHGPPATLTLNDSGHYEARWVRLQATSGKCVFFAGMETFEVPVAHAEGKFVPRDPDTLSRLEAAGQIVLRYVPQGEPVAAAGNAFAPRAPYPSNPNGSIADVAGVCDETGRVAGLMPHPERHLDATQHPRWTRRREQPAAGAGLRVFQNAVNYFQ